MCGEYKRKNLSILLTKGGRLGRREPRRRRGELLEFEPDLWYNSIT